MGRQLHIALLPMIAPGHTIPMLDMAMLFTSRGLKTTIIGTPALAGPIKGARESGHDIGLVIIDFPPKGSSLPDNIVSFDQMITPDLLPKFFEALALLQEPAEELLQELSPDCLISDMFLPWTADSAAKFGIPRLVFHGTSCFALCLMEQMYLHKPYKNVSSDSEPFVIPNLPDEFTFTRIQVTEFFEDGNNEFDKLGEQRRESERRSYGVVFNSFYELESAYADHYKKVLGRRAWHIGPLFLCNHTRAKEKAVRGNESSIDEHKCLAWLDSKTPNSVVYVSFGSIVSFTPTQLHEMAVGLEASGQDFIWVVRKEKNEGDNEDWMLQEYEDRIKGRGLIIRGWAPQVMILDHPAIGAFVTHCGWNSTLEGICGGVPMVTWPVFAEQFYNEKLVTEVLRTGVSVGSKKWQTVANEGVPSEAVTKAVGRVMAGEEALAMRKRAKYYKEMARKAVEEGGSSYNSLNAFIDELSIYCSPLKKQDIN
ncbi:UNVERIFIED_CONTAM: Scopoletin glucosyltransferase [Sesamum latifolium]|uniref:Glycosyltransferase n=1 Tax=Sesamum latifolium TaxID=2727402 RepID=A0AAW2TSW2_9LAMI